MRGKDEVGALGDDQLAGNASHHLLDGFNLFQQNHGINDHAVTNHVHSAFAENTGGNRVKHKMVTAKDQGMTGIGTTLETGYHLVGGSEHIHYFAFTLVAPLEAEYHI